MKNLYLVCMVYSINFWVKVNQLPNYKCFNNWLLTSVLKTNCDLKSVKVALGVCFALKSLKEYLLLFTYLITLGKDVTLPLITKFKTNRPLSNLFVNRKPNKNVAPTINSCYK